MTDAAARQQARIRELELFIALMAALFGLNVNDRQWRLRIHVDRAFGLRRLLGAEPVVIASIEDDYYIMDVIAGGAVLT